MTAIVNDNKINIINPVYQETITILDCTPEDQVNTIIQAACDFKDWKNLMLTKRCDNIDKLRKIILKHQFEVRDVLQKETGKKDFDVFIELFGLMEHMKETSKIAKIALRPSPRNVGIMKNKKAYVKYEPLGVAGIISPWNFPLVTPTTTCIEGLLAGNNVILKPSEHTPLTSKCIKNIWDDEGLRTNQILQNKKNIHIYSWSNSAKKFNNCFMTILGQSSS